MSEKIVNVLGAFGYLSILCQWLWAAVTLGGPLLKYDAARSLLLPDQSPTPDVTTTSSTMPELVTVLFVIFAVVFSVGISLYALFALPRAVARTGHKVTVTTARVALPHVTHHKKITKKQKKRLIERLTWSVKVLLVAIPLVGLLVPIAPELGLDQIVVTTAAVFCAVASSLWFALQFSVAKLAGVSPERVW